MRLRLLAPLLLIAMASGTEPAPEFTDVELKRIARHSPLPPPPPDPTNRVADDPAAAHLGQYLFFDTRLSTDGTVSCATCHDPAQGWSNGKAFGEGLGTTKRHTQSLFNVGHNRWYYWDGRVDTLWSQALKPMEAAEEMGGNRMAIARLMADDPPLRSAYEAIFGPLPDMSDTDRFPEAARPVPGDPRHPHQVAWAGMSAGDRRTVDGVFANVGKVIAAYERRLASRDASFDTFAAGLATGDEDRLAVLSPSAQRGLKLFVGRANCHLCHSGPNFSDGEFHNIGLPRRDGAMPRDPGRFEGVRSLSRDPFSAGGPYSDERRGARARQAATVLHEPDQWGQFKTPSLRSVTTSAPYMHQGQFDRIEDVLDYYSTLEDMVQMGHHQDPLLQPLQLTLQEINDLITFLESLAGAPLDPTLLEAPTHPRMTAAPPG